MQAAICELGTILGVWAHPDDEAYLSAGLMALSRRNGQRVVVVTATAGERGTPDPATWPPDRLRALRRRELAASLAAVGVTEHHWLDWPDGGCAAVPAGVGAGQIAAVLRDVQPDTILTFGPDGWTGHPDHRAVSSWTTEAWEAGGRRARLLYATVTPEFHRRWGALHDRLGVWMDAERDRPCTPQASLAVQVRCSGDLLDQKLAALRAHASQTAPLVAELGEDTFRAWSAIEPFVDARVAGHADVALTGAMQR